MCLETSRMKRFLKFLQNPGHSQLPHEGVLTALHIVRPLLDKLKQCGYGIQGRICTMFIYYVVVVCCVLLVGFGHPFTLVAEGVRDQLVSHEVLSSSSSLLSLWLDLEFLRRHTSQCVCCRC